MLTKQLSDLITVWLPVNLFSEQKNVLMSGPEK